MADKALLSGINNYKSISDLRGCVNDVRSMQKLLSGVYGFDQKNIRTLTDEQVTKERILREWDWLLKGAHAGDRLVFHLSGHGSFIDDKDGDESDNVDELFCLYDMDFDDPQTYLLDDDLRRLTERIPEGVHFTFLLDTCHSGTGTRLMLGQRDVRGLVSDKYAPIADLASSIQRMSSRQVRSLGDADSDVPVDQLLNARTLGEARNTVLVRFVQPPPHVIAAIERKGIPSLV